MKKNMRKIVQMGYQKGDYTGAFRTSDKPQGIEKHFLDYLIKALSKNAHVLDLGCGTGVPFDKYLVDHGVQVTGIDITDKHFEQAKKNVPNATFIKGDFSRHDFGDKQFDAIVAFYSIFHIPREEHQSLFKKMNSLLNKNGLILTTLGTGDSDCAEEEWCGAPMAWSNHSPKVYKGILKKTGFKIVKDEFEGKPGDEEYHWWLMAQKI